MMSRMIAAAARPMPSEPIAPCSACWMVWPPSATCDAVVDARVGDVEHLLAVRDRHVGGFTTSSRAWATRVGRRGRRRPGSVNGSSTATTCGTSASSASRSVTSAWTAGSGRPPSAWTTTSTVSPDSAGNRSSSSVWAWLGVRAGRGVVGLELAAEGRGQHDGDARRAADPGEHGAAAAAEGDAGQPAERADGRAERGLAGVGWRDGVVRWPSWGRSRCRWKRYDS